MSTASQTQNRRMAESLENAIRVDPTPDFSLLMRILKHIKLRHYGDGICSFDTDTSPAWITILSPAGHPIGCISKVEIARVLAEFIGR
jgi:hypothetical protein